ncbi:ParA family protein [Caballeronia novacaledonica]|uniref:ParA family protein n=1 Tax=Caballeronia novacaledonica TaxID=1544861 RepID=A0ACB5R761_9BURK|nr:ParA family protein [Caballeronia novacaledonica]
MKTIAVTLNKGGTGKTTLTKSLAAAATATGLDVLILDMDTQQNSEKWGRRRKDRHKLELPFVKFVTEGDLIGELDKARNNGCDLVFIDTPPGRNTEAPAAVEVADLVLIPIWNDQDSYDGLEKTVGLARRMGKPAVSILNFATPNSRIHEEEAREVVAACNVEMAPHVLHRYDAHRLASAVGLTAQEMDPESIPAREIAQLWEWICAQVHPGTGAPVRRKSKQKVAS